MKSFAAERLKKEDGASLVAALLFFVLCGVGASVILASASASAGKMQQVPAADQKRFAVESAAVFLRDELTRPENTVKIREVWTVIEGDRSGEEDTVKYYYVGAGQKPDEESSWSAFASDSQGEALLDSFIQYFDVLLPDREITQAAKTTQEKTLPLLVEAGRSKGTQTVMEEIAPLKTSVKLSMEPDYKITAIISDMQTDENHPEDLCERKLTVPAQVLEDIDVEVEDHEETDAEGNVTEAWTKTTTTRLTTIQWHRGTIERIHPEKGTS